MPLTLQDLLKDRSLLQRARHVQGRCEICKQDVLEGEATQQMRDGLAHDGCFYDELGAEIEKNPIGGAYRRG